MKINPHSLILKKRALLRNKKIILPEEKDARIIEASKILSDYGFNIISIQDLLPKLDIYKNIISKYRFTNNWTNDMLEKYVSDSINLSLIALQNNDVGSVVCGAATSSADVIRSSIRIVGLKKTTNLLSSIFYMISNDYKKTYTFADCAVVPDPNSKQLSLIAYEAALTHQLLSNKKPKVAFLSFSTKGSANHYKVKKIQDAINIFKRNYSEILHDGEMQFDAAISKSVAQAKNSIVLKGDANVFIFPDLDSGNIGYKIAQYLGKFYAWGPLLQGLNKPVHDLSRGCTVDDIVSVSIIAALQSN